MTIDVQTLTEDDVEALVQWALKRDAKTTKAKVLVVSSSDDEELQRLRTQLSKTEQERDEALGDLKERDHAITEVRSILANAGIVGTSVLPEAVHQLRDQRDAMQRERDEARAEATKARLALEDRVRNEEAAAVRRVDQGRDVACVLSSVVAERDQLHDTVSAMDRLVTSLRAVLTAAGIPESEPYPDDDPTVWERAPRTGVRVIPTLIRLERLVAERDEARRERSRLRATVEQVRQVRRVTLYSRGEYYHPVHCILATDLDNALAKEES